MEEAARVAVAKALRAGEQRERRAERHAAVAATAAAIAAKETAVQELQAQLEQALNRVAALEAKLEEQAQLQEDVKDVKDLREEVKGLKRAQRAVRSSAADSKGLPEMLRGWSPTFSYPGNEDARPSATPASSTPMSSAHHRPHPGSPSSASGTVYMRRPFNFEEFRRANSQGLQNERLRVLLPPDRVAMFPVPLK